MGLNPSVFAYLCVRSLEANEGFNSAKLGGSQPSSSFGEAFWGVVGVTLIAKLLAGDPRLKDS